MPCSEDDAVAADDGGLGTLDCSGCHVEDAVRLRDEVDILNRDIPIREPLVRYVNEPLERRGTPNSVTPCEAATSLKTA
jgi:hypothetical protein